MKYKLKDLVTIQYGKNQKAVEDNENGKVPILGTGGTIGYATNFLYDKPSVLIGRKGTIDKIRYVDFPFWTIDTLFYTEINQKLVIPQYLYYKLLEINFKNLNEGTTIPSLRTQTLYELELDIDSIDKQNKIVNILSLIDKKIEYNMHTNNNLLEIGKSLYQKYFENDKYTNNYEIKQLSEVTTNNRNKVDKYREYKVLSAVNTGNLVLSDDYFDKQVYSKDIGKYLNVNKNDFAYNPARINIGSIGLNTFDYNCCVSPVYVTFSVDKDYIDFFDFYFKSKKFNAEVTLRASGSVRQALNYNDFGMIEIPYPSREIIDKFNNSYIKIKNRINKNKTKIRNLEQLRDTLLPKLMNGEIDLDKVEI